MMSKIFGIIIILLSAIDYFTGFVQCSPIGYTLFGLVPPLDLPQGCSMLTVLILFILGLGLFFWKTNESKFKN